MTVIALLAEALLVNIIGGVAAATFRCYVDILLIDMAVLAGRILVSAF